MGALSALDISLWDIAGKYFGVPVYRLMGGKTRDKARVYYHVFGDTREKLVDGVRRARETGFTAVGHLTPFLDEPRDVPYFQTHVNKMRDAIEAVASYREVAGEDVDLCIEIHRRLTPAEAITLARGIEQYHPFFYEDPILPENFDAMELVARNIHVPIATGERLHSIHEFEMLLKRGAVQYVRPDVCLAGGLTHSKKIAAVAEAHYVGVVPHNPLTPVSTAACLQLAACIPNFALQEYPLGEDVPPKSEIVVQAPRLEGGFLIVPDSPGIGIELAEDAQERYPPKPREVRDTSQRGRLRRRPVAASRKTNRPAGGQRMNVEFVVLRLLHIVFGVFWVGSAVFLAAVLEPRLRALGPAIQRPVMRDLGNVMGPIIGISGFITISAGIALALRLRWDTLDRWFQHRMGLGDLDRVHHVHPGNGHRWRHGGCSAANGADQPQSRTGTSQPRTDRPDAAPGSAPDRA